MQIWLYCSDKEILVTIDKAINSSIELRSKKELIEGFLARTSASAKIDDDWQEFVKEQAEIDLHNLIESEKLKPEETHRFVENTFRDGVLKTTGTDIDKILPPISRFGGGEDRTVKKQTVVEKLTAYFDRYMGLL